jgi:hypothetical protein
VRPESVEDVLPSKIYACAALKLLFFHDFFFLIFIFAHIFY